MHTIWYQPNRAFGTDRQVEEGELLENGFPAYSSVWGDKNNYGNRGERYLAGVAFLEGADKQPSAVMCRGYYTRSYLWAVDFDGKELKTKWLHASLTPNDWKVTDANGKVLKEAHGCKNTAYAQGAHSLAVGDVDGDGCDEITMAMRSILLIWIPTDRDWNIIWYTKNIPTVLICGMHEQAKSCSVHSIRMIPEEDWLLISMPSIGDMNFGVRMLLL